MKSFRRIATSIVSGFILFFIAFIFLTSCNTSADDTYNEGYKAGFTDGYTSAVKKQATPTGEEEKADNATPDPDVAQDKRTKEATIANNPGVPQKAILVLDYIRKNDKAPDGYVGGRVFGNYEKHLPERDAAGNKIKYQEWDIHAKVEGKNRGAQRLVTGSDGRAWYTADHYNSFTEISTQ